MMTEEVNSASVEGDKTAGVAQLMIGAEAKCTDGSCGEVRRLVIDPATLEVSHLVVEPLHRQGLGRLVPLDLVDVSTGEVRVDCTRAQFEALDHAEETELLPASGGHADYPAGRALPQPYEGLSNVIGDVPEPVIYDTVPSGEVEVMPGERVHATDGPIGSVKGVVIDTRTRHVTHLLLREGHVWGHKNVAIPADAVIAIDNGIQLNLSKRDVEDLRPAEEN
jgi:sporulation protein YlmC with PRC-barrel domain